MRKPIGDTASLGITRYIRQWQGIDPPGLECSRWYNAGGWAAVAVEVATGVGGIAKAGGKFALRKALKEGGEEGFEVVQRAMSRAELEAMENGLVRGGRNGPHYVSDAVNSDALRARQRLALGETPEVRVTMEVPRGAFSPPSRVAPLNNMPGGGLERTATGNIPARITGVHNY